jgi:hypothetical protein
MTLEETDVEGGQVVSPLLANSIPRAPTSASQMEISDDVSGKNKAIRRKHSHHYLTRQSPGMLQLFAVVLAVGTFVTAPMLPIQWCILLLVFSSCAFGGIVSMWLSRAVLACDDGTAEMRAVSDPIAQGSHGFLTVQYSVSCLAGALELGRQDTNKLVPSLFPNTRLSPSLLSPLQDLSLSAISFDPLEKNQLELQFWGIPSLVL